VVVFEVYLNGKRIALAGKEDLGVLSTTVSAVGKLGPATKRRGNEGYDIHMNVGGLTARKRGADEHVNWASVRPVKIGDEISVRITRGERADPPQGRSPRDTKSTRISERKRFEFAKALYYHLRRKYEGKGLTRRSTGRAAKAPRAG
jgi:hypothetical protein